MFINYQNISVGINNRNIICDNIELSNNIELTPKYLVDNIASERSAPNKMWNGSLRLQYYLTGIDYIKQFIYSKNCDTITGNVGGIIFNQGYLSQYSIDVEPNTPIKVNATISFFDNATGNLKVSSQVVSTGLIFRSSDLTINNLQSYTENPINNFLKGSFNYSCNLQPSYCYADTGSLPSRADKVFIQERTLSTEIVSDGTGLSLPLSGESFGAIFTFYNPYNTGLYETVGCSGKIFEKDLSFSTDNPHNQTIKIIQNNITKEGYIYSVSTGTNQLIIRSNSGSFPFRSVDSSLPYVNSVSVGDIQLNNPVVIRFPNYDQIVATVPPNILDGIVKVQTSYGNYIWPNKINFSYQDITVNPLSPISGSPGQNIYISGTNFIQISDVIFGGNIYANFQVYDSQNMIVTIPNGGSSGPITISSYYRNKSGLSQTFYYQPTILSFSPTTGVWKDTISITGSNFTGTTGVYFNKSPAFSFSIVNNNNILALTPETGIPFPSGNINLYGTGGFTSSISVYNPTIPIYNFTPSSGSPHTKVTIYTKIDTGYYCPISGGYKVKMGGIDCVFSVSGLNSTGALTGVVPNSSLTDYIYIYKPDGISTSASKQKFNIIGAPRVDYILPNEVAKYSDNTMLIYGENLSFFYDNASFVRISGGSSGDVQTYNTGLFTTALDGKSMAINSFVVSGNTGVYDFYIQNSVSGFNLPQALNVTPPIDIVPSLTWLPMNRIPNSLGGEYAVDGSYNTYVGIFTPTNASYNNFYMLYDDTNQGFDLYKIFINYQVWNNNLDGRPPVASRLIGRNPDGSFLSEYFSGSYSGSILCFDKNSLCLYSGARQLLSGYSISFSPPLTGVNFVKFVAGPNGNTLSANSYEFFPIYNINMY